MKYNFVFKAFTILLTSLLCGFTNPSNCSNETSQSKLIRRSKNLMLI